MHQISIRGIPRNAISRYTISRNLKKSCMPILQIGPPREMQFRGTSPLAISRSPVCRFCKSAHHAKCNFAVHHLSHFKKPCTPILQIGAAREMPFRGTQPLAISRSPVRGFCKSATFRKTSSARKTRFDTRKKLST